MNDDDRRPSLDTLRSLAFAARDVGKHIKRFWSIDGGALPEMAFGIAGTARTFEHVSELLGSVFDDERGHYPGKTIEFLFRDVLSEWTKLVRGVPVLYNGYLDHFMGWNDGVMNSTAAILHAMGNIVRCTSKGMPNTFSGEDVECVIHESERLLALMHFAPNELQNDVLTTLKRRALTGEQLMAELLIGSKETLYGKRGRGGVTELKVHGLVAHDRRLGGYYRPEFPPA